MNRVVKLKTLFIIGGASGEIGAEFVRRLIVSQQVIGISRENELDISSTNLRWLHFDLANPNETYKIVERMDFSKFARVVFIHSIGIDKFENIDYPRIDKIETIDPVVYNSNVNTYKYFATALIKKLGQERKGGAKTQLTLAMIGSVADKHGLIFLTSFSESKNIVRGYMRDAVGRYPWVTSLAINISSTITKSALKIRPHADTTYWLTPQEVVKKSLSTLLETTQGYKEINLYKKDPQYEPDYYTNNDKVFRRWSKYVFGDNLGGVDV